MIEIACRLSHTGQTYFDMGRRRREGGENEQKVPPYVILEMCKFNHVSHCNHNAKGVKK
jgi:hypothetical protein